MWRKNVSEVCNDNVAAQKDLKYCDINEELVSLDYQTYTDM
jgi:hypothetical protein